MRAKKIKQEDLAGKSMLPSDPMKKLVRKKEGMEGEDKSKPSMVDEGALGSMSAVRRREMEEGR